MGPVTGAIHMLPLGQVFLESEKNWKEVFFFDWQAGTQTSFRGQSRDALAFARSLRVFDYFHTFNMAALATSEPDFPVLIGDDHGASFTDSHTASFEDYLEAVLASWFSVQARVDAFIGGDTTRAATPAKPVALGALVKKLTKPAPRAERILVYRLADLPSELTANVPVGSPLENCLFWIAPSTSKAIDALFEELPEKKLKDGKVGLAIADVVLRAAGQAARLARLFDPEVEASGRTVRGTQGQEGFHSAPAAEVEAFLRGRGAELLPISTVLDDLALVRVEGAGKKPLDYTSFVVNVGRTYDADPVGPQLFAFDRTDRANQHFALSTKGRKPIELRMENLPLRRVHTMRWA